nr:DUF4199 domain-containing protein [uncultured Carboxylicivirga sp.]
MENEKSPLIKSGINNGVIFGIILIVINVLFYVLVDIESISLIVFGILGVVVSFIPFVVVLAILIKRYRDKDLGGFMKYGDGLLYGTFITFIAAVLVAVYSLAFNNFIDPDYTRKVQESVTEKTLTFMESSGVPQSEIDKQMEKLDENAQSQIDDAKFMGPVKSILWSTIMGFVISLILAAIFKKEKPIFETQVE